MPWFPLSDDLNDDPRFVSLSDSALAAWTRAASWSARRLTDGHVPASMVAQFTRYNAEAADELVEAGVWARVRGGRQMVDFPESAKSGAVAARREADRRRQQEHRSSRAVSSRRDTGVTPPDVTDTSHSTYAQDQLFGSSSEEPKSSVGGSGGKRRARAKRPEVPLPGDWEPTDSHTAFAAENDLDLKREAKRFRLHAETHDRRAVQWNSAFRSWLETAVERRPQLRAVSGGYATDSRTGRRTELA